MLKLLTRLFTAVTLAGVFWSAQAMAQEAPIRKVERAFKRVERSMCQSLELKNCKTAKIRKPRVDTGVAAPPLPRERPNKSNEDIPVEVAEAPPPKPVLRPAKNRKTETEPLPKPALKPVLEKTAALTKPEKQPPEPQQDMPKKEEAPQSSGCAARLAALGATFKQEATPANQGQCSISNPVRLSSVKTAAKPILFSDEPILSCEFAATLAGWARDVAGPLVKATTKQPLVAMATGPGFDCRGRNGDGSGKMSEHASGNAVDVGTFKLGDGKVLNVKGSNATLDALRAAACESFTTVLGPGSNSAHEEHFHFDLARRKNGYRVCN
jgi:hypothetical protein